MSKPIRILIVDDEEDILEFLQYNLEKAGYEVSQALDGNMAIEMAKKHQPHLIVMDVMMPNMDGIEACEQIRKIPALVNCLICFLTARNESFTQISALDGGGDDFVSKPIKPNVLLSRIRAMLRRHKDLSLNEDNGNIQTFGTLSINHETFMVTVDGKEISMAKKEFELLALLATKPGKVFKRDEIMKKIWGDDIIVGDRTLDVHIRKIREKIGDAYISTLKGVGYKFEF
ncbi:MAG: response regulator transcription factor [Saprospiraceae bacterium]|nr:response regulator transcription factor [Saprospiraceae bacterium]